MTGTRPWAGEPMNWPDGPAHVPGRPPRERHSRLVFPKLRAVEPRFRGIPLWHAAPVPHDESVPHVHALTSLVLFRPDGTVAKIYAPGIIPRLLYRLAFQAPFPYIENRMALEAAVLRRNLAGMLTQSWYGENLIARACGIEQIGARYALVSEIVPGTPPRDTAAVRAFLFDLAARFDAAGLPSWQIDPRQPRALGNLIERPDGRFVVIDLESGVVSPLASPRAWWRAFRRGSVPIFDEVAFDVTRAAIARDEGRLRAAHGEPWLATLREMLDAADAAQHAWQESEPRIWSRIVRGLWDLAGFARASMHRKHRAVARPTHLGTAT